MSLVLVRREVGSVNQEQPPKMIGTGNWIQDERRLKITRATRSEGSGANVALPISRECYQRVSTLT